MGTHGGRQLDHAVRAQPILAQMQRGQGRTRREHRGHQHVQARGRQHIVTHVERRQLGRGALTQRALQFTQRVVIEGTCAELDVGDNRCL